MQDVPDAPPLGDELEVLVETQLEEDGVQFTGELLYSGWTSLSVTRPLDAAAGSFELSVADRRPWPLKPGAPVRVLLAGKEIVRGYVDTFEGSSSPKGRRIRIAGRDRTADLVDCAATNEPGEWLKTGILSIIRDLASPFGIEVEAPDEGQQSWNVAGLALAEPVPVFKLQHGETAWAAIERLLRARGFLGFTDGSGVLIISRPGDERSEVPIVEGPSGNVMRSRFSWSNKDRFQTYVVRGQSPGGDEGWGAVVAEIEGVAEDSHIERFRPWLSMGETSLTFSSAADRAQWEATVRAARAQTLEVQLQGWRRGFGLDVWRVNEIVPVKIPSLGIETDMLVNRVRFTRDRNSGTRTVLQLIRADAYLPKPEVPGEGPLDAVLEDEGWDVE